MDIPEKSIRDLLNNGPSQGTLYILLSIMKDRGLFSAVISECLKALSRFPDDLKIRKILAETYLADGRLLEAETEFSKVTEGIKALSGAYRSRAEIFVRQKREAEAIESLMHYLAYNPEDEETAVLLKEMQSFGRKTETEMPEGQEVASAPDSDEPEDFPEIITASLAETYFDQGQLDEAGKIYEKLIEKDPEDTVSKSRLEEISALMNKRDESEDIEVENEKRRKKEKMISVLDSWRSNIRDLAEESLTAG